MLGEDWYTYGDWGLDVDEDTAQPAAATRP